MPNNLPSVDGVLLAGGRARRFDGQDKGLLLLAGETLASRAAARLRRQTGSVMIVANRHQAEYERLGYPVVSDVIDGFAGPLAGIHAGMTAATHPWILSAPCDSPFFPPDLKQRLLTAAIAANAVVAVAVANDCAQPVFMLAQTALRDDLEKFIAAGDGKIDRWYGRLEFTEVRFADAKAFDNINTPDDLAAAEAKVWSG